MTSRPLFIIVAESTVILAPMSQFGCVVALARTHSGSFSHFSNSSSAFKSRKAPPEAVNMILRRLPGGQPCKHWKIAECSESAGVIETPYSSTSGKIAGPPAMRVSLLAKAMSFPASIASTVGSKPAHPTTPVTITSASPHVAHAAAASFPYTTSTPPGKPPRSASASSKSAFFEASDNPTTFTVSLNSWTWSANSFQFDPAHSEEISNRSGRARAKSRVCVPMDPVLPRTPTFRVQTSSSSSTSSVLLKDCSFSTGAA
mmetsp:Transcript_20090/g.64698  ORF Transcript_20090/g.64698 Transcript_20090/m.64698 type:complete len:259 (+) Transcript_20090:960-1736(+)